jgi:phosphoribosyl-ATP pyrophosphohydrolase
MAWGQAKGAKKAAEEATETVRARETEYEFSRLADDAKELLAAVQGKQKDKAIEAANHLSHLLIIASGHRATYLPEGFSTELCVENLRKVSTSLASEGFSEVPQKMVKLLNRCHQIHEELCGISGSVQSRTEGTEG